MIAPNPKLTPGMMSLPGVTAANCSSCVCSNCNCNCKNIGVLEFVTPLYESSSSKEVA